MHYNKNNVCMLKSSEIDALVTRIAKKLYELNDEVLSVADVARMLGKTEGAVKKMCYRGLLPHRKQELQHLSHHTPYRYLRHLPI